MLTLTILAVVVLGAASIYATVKSVDAIFSCNVLGWMIWTQLAKGLGEIVSALIRSTDN